jgi:large subunit ribosomal protein L7A
MQETGGAAVLSELKTGSRVVGAKQAKRAIDDGRALRVFLARDADPRVTEPLEALCKGKNVPVETSCTMSELGSACNIAVGSAVAALIK